MTRLLLYTVGLFIWSLAGNGRAQNYLGADFSIGVAQKSGPWSALYGHGIGAGFAAEWHAEQRWMVRIQSQILITNDVTFDPLSSLRDASGSVIGNFEVFGSYANISVSQRGYRQSIQFGYHQPVGTSKFSLFGYAGPNYTYNFLRINEDPQITTDNLRSEYIKGYDRATGGFGVSSVFGGQFYDRRGGYKAYLGLSYSGYSPESLRSTQFDLRAPYEPSGWNGSLGITAGFVIAVVRPTAISDAEEIYY